MENDLLVLFLLFTKHAVADFPLQPKWMWANKGTLGHPGGIAHALVHGVATYVILAAFIDVRLASALAWAELFAHYAIDWAKMNLNAKLGYTPINGPGFWNLLGFDQWLHAMTYLAIVYGAHP